MQILTKWHEARDARLIPFHDMTMQMAKFAEPNEREAALYRALERNTEATTKFLGLITGSTKPQEFFSPDNLHEILAGRSSL